MQPGRDDTPFIASERLVITKDLVRSYQVRLSICGTPRIVTVAVVPDTSGTPCGTSSIAMRTGTRWARRSGIISAQHFKAVDTLPCPRFDRNIGSAKYVR